MTEEESYLFDLRGFIVVKNALQQDQIDDLSQRLEAHRSSNLSPILGSDRTVLGDDRDAWSAPSLLELGGAYLDLIDLPTIVPYLTKLLGEQYRLDHDYAKIDSKMPEREKTLYLHGGGQGAGRATRTSATALRNIDLDINPVGKLQTHTDRQYESLGR